MAGTSAGSEHWLPGVLAVRDRVLLLTIQVAPHPGGALCPWASVRRWATRSPSSAVTYISAAFEAAAPNGPYRRTTGSAWSDLLGGGLAVTWLP